MAEGPKVAPGEGLSVMRLVEGWWTEAVAEGGGNEGRREFHFVSKNLPNMRNERLQILPNKLQTSFLFRVKEKNVIPTCVNHRPQKLELLPP